MPEGDRAPWSAQVIEDAGQQRAFVSLDDREGIATEHPAILSTVLRQLRVLFESWHNRSGGILLRKVD
jgi:hypothetical protein